MKIIYCLSSINDWLKEVLRTWPKILKGISFGKLNCRYVLTFFRSGSVILNSVPFPGKLSKKIVPL